MSNILSFYGNLKMEEKNHKFSCFLCEPKLIKACLLSCLDRITISVSASLLSYWKPSSTGYDVFLVLMYCSYTGYDDNSKAPLDAAMKSLNYYITTDIMKQLIEKPPCLLASIFT